LVLAHCNRNKCPITPSLRRTLLELTVAEWNQAKRSGDTEAEKLRHKEAIAVRFHDCRKCFLVSHHFELSHLTIICF
jgi:hypothetical protein